MTLMNSGLNERARERANARARAGQRELARVRANERAIVTVLASRPSNSNYPPDQLRSDRSGLRGRPYHVQSQGGAKNYTWHEA